MQDTQILPMPEASWTPAATIPDLTRLSPEVSPSGGPQQRYLWQCLRWSLVLLPSCSLGLNCVLVRDVHKPCPRTSEVWGWDLQRRLEEAAGRA